MSFKGEDNSFTRLLKQKNQPIPLSEFSERALAAAYTTGACREFPVFQKTFSESFSEMKNQDKNEDPKEFFMHRAINEVMLSAVFTLEACGQIINLSNKPKGSDILTLRAAVETITNQQSLHIRKLLEVLLLCASFRKHDQPEFYRHFLLLVDLDQLLGRIQDSKEFLEKVSAFEINQVEALGKEIKDFEKTYPFLSKAFYISDKDPKKRLQKNGFNIASSRKLYKQVSKDATLRLRTTIGFSYEVIFGSSSKLIHFMPSKVYTTGKVNLYDVNNLFGQQSLLEHNILIECMELLDITPGEHCKTIAKSFEDNFEFLSEAAENFVLRKFEINDYVVCLKTLFKVTQLHVSAYGLPSCYVERLEGHLKRSDWVPTSMMTLYRRVVPNENITDEDIISIWSQENIEE